MKKEKYHFRNEIIELLKNKVPYKEIVKKYGVSKRYLYNLKAMKFGKMKVSSKKYFDNLYNEINLCFTSIKLAYYKTILICRKNRCAKECLAFLSFELISKDNPICDLGYSIAYDSDNDCFYCSNCKKFFSNLEDLINRKKQRS